MEGYREILLEPLDVAIDEMRKKVSDLDAVISLKEPNKKLLQLQLHGSLRLQVGEEGKKDCCVVLS